MNDLPLPSPSEYIESVLNDIRDELVRDRAEVVKTVSRKILGYSVRYGTTHIDEKCVEDIRKRISPEVIQGAMTTLVEQVEKDIPKAISKRFIRILANDIVQKIYEDIEHKVYDKVLADVEERVNACVTQTVNKKLEVWHVTEKLIK